MTRVAEILTLLALLAAPAIEAFSDDANSGRRQPSKRATKDEPKQDLKALASKLKAAVEKGEMTRREAYEVHRLLVFYVALDTNGNKMLEPEEYANNRSRPTIERRIRETGMDPSRPIALNAFMSKRLGNAGIKPVQVKKYVDYDTKPGASSSQTRVTLDLPDKYIALDANKDNQLGLYEWPRAERPEFFRLDLNHDGFVTPREFHIVETTPDHAEERHQKDMEHMMRQFAESKKPVKRGKKSRKKWRR
jgi:hypothetical protein